MKILMGLAAGILFASAIPAFADSNPIDVVKAAYANEGFSWTQFATQAPTAFSKQFISTWRAVMKFKSCNFYDADILTGEGYGGGPGTRRLNSTALTMQSGDHAEVTANVTPDSESGHSKNIKFELIREHGLWRIDDIVMPDSGDKIPGAIVVPASTTAYLNQVIRTKCADYN